MRANRYHHLGWLQGIELYEADFSTQTFSRHAHEGFAIGAIAEGVGGYLCRGEQMLLPAGSLSLMNPEEPHTGHAAAGSVRYNMVYASEAAVRTLLDLKDLRGFATVAPRDEGLHLTQALSRLAQRVNAPAAPGWRLAVEEAMQAVLGLAFTRHGRAALRPAGQEPAAVKRVRERIAEGVASGDDLSLEGLAALAGLTPSYLIRSFSRATGLTPHAMVLRMRTRQAQALILDGMAPADAALAAGFCDQSHMIRQFRRQLGITPGSLIRH